MLLPPSSTTTMNPDFIEYSQNRPGYIQTDFELTPKMSTYLVAFIVSNLVLTPNPVDVNQSGKPRVAIYTRNEVASMTG